MPLLNRAALLVYSLLMWLAQPLLRARLRQRGVAEPGYLAAMDERFGRYVGGAPPSSGYVWIHAVSLGETRAVAILMERLRAREPNMRLLLTHGTATGRAEGASLLRAGDVQAWQPWDTPGAVQRFLAHFRPRIGILMETEVWPNLSAACQRAAVPLVLANARLSEQSQRKAQRLGWLSRPAYGSLAAVLAQTDDDAQRLAAVGAPVAGVLGNIKFDATPDAAQLAQGARWRQAWRNATQRPVVMFASSRAGEEAGFLKILENFRAVALVGIASSATKSGVINPEANQARENDIQWLVVPRHPQRVDEVAALIESHGLRVSRRSSWGDGPPGVTDIGAADTIWLGDSLGEMSLYYGLADVALLGGSFEALGGQNLIEAAACGCPVVMGPHTFNFAEASDFAEAAGAAIRVDDLAQGVATAQRLVRDDAALLAAQNACEVFLHPHRGAAERLAGAILQQLKMTAKA
jgi:3-deoxy-D-manno-octulosonic-acid transferase